MLDFFLHNVNGLPSGANPSPLVTGLSQYQTYGRYSARIKSETVPNYYAAWPLWPVSDKNGGCAESDFPETNLGNDTVTAFAHNSTKCKNYSVQTRSTARHASTTAAGTPTPRNGARLPQILHRRHPARHVHNPGMEPERTLATPDRAR